MAAYDGSMEPDKDTHDQEGAEKPTLDVNSFCERFIVCKRCNKTCEDPVMLSCLHTFCLDCQREASRATERAVEATDEFQGDFSSGLEERDESQHSDEGEVGVTDESESGWVPSKNENLLSPHECVIEKPLVSRPLSNIVNAAKLKEKLPQGKMECKMCKKDIAKWICYDKKCGNIPLCDFCREAHRRQIETQDHQVVEIDPESDWWKGVVRRTWPCFKPKHSDRLVDLYCTFHDVVVCERCALVDHTNSECDLKEVDDVDADPDNRRLSGLQKVEELNHRFRSAIEEGKDIKRTLETKRDKAIAALNDRYNRLVQQLTIERDEAKAKAELICDLKKKEIDDHQTVLERVTETLEDSLEFIKDYSDVANPAEFMFLKTQLIQRLDYLHDRYSTFDLSPADDDELYLKPSNDDLPPNILGIVRSTPCVKKFKVKDEFQNSDGSLTITIECCDIAGSHVSMRVLPKLKAVVTPENGEIDDGVTCQVKPNRGNGCYVVSVPVSEDHGNKKLHIYQSRPFPHRQYHMQRSPFKFNSAPPSKTILHPRILIHL